MSVYTEKAKKIRSKIARYEKLSVLEHLLKHLHYPENSALDTAKKMPYIAFLLIEWLYQVKPLPQAVTANSDDVNRLLNEVYALQSSAVNFKDEVHHSLAIRKMITAQLWPQQSKLYRWFNLARFYSMTIGPGVSVWFASDFERAHKLSLKNFYTLSLWLLVRFDENRNSIQYERAIIELTPYFSVEEVASFFKIVAGTLNDLCRFLEPLADESVKVDSFFANTQLTKMPVILLENCITTPHASLLSKAISNFVLEDFKSRNHQEFRQRFTKEFEKYVRIVLEESSIRFIPESVIQDAYKEEGLTDQKVVDFLINHGDSTVFIDAKGIEPHRRVQVSDNSRILKDKLKTSFTHGVFQAYGCASAISQLKTINISSRESTYALIVTHHDFYLSNGTTINTQVDPTLHDRLVAKYGDHIPIEHVYFVSIDDFEGIMKLCKDSSTTVSEFLSFCVEQDSRPETRKFDTRQHITAYTEVKEIERKGPIGTDHIIERKQEIFEHLEEAIRVSRSHWIDSNISGLPSYCTSHDLLKEKLDLTFKLRPYLHHYGIMV